MTELPSAPQEPVKKSRRGVIPFLILGLAFLLIGWKEDDAFLAVALVFLVLAGVRWIRSS